MKSGYKPHPLSNGSAAISYPSSIRNITFIATIEFSMTRIAHDISLNCADYGDDQTIMTRFLIFYSSEEHQDSGVVSSALIVRDLW